MSDISEALRFLVTARAKGGFEYCLLPAEGQVGLPGRPHPSADGRRLVGAGEPRTGLPSL